VLDSGCSRGSAPAREHRSRRPERPGGGPWRSRRGRVQPDPARPVGAGARLGAYANRRLPAPTGRRSGSRWARSRDGAVLLRSLVLIARRLPSSGRRARARRTTSRGRRSRKWRSSSPASSSRWCR
jgi:hypothetical protein